MRIIIIGSGVAAVEAAKKVRDGDENIEVEIYSRESSLPYRRPALTRMLMEALPEKQFLLHPAEFYDKLRIQLHLNNEVAGINSDQQIIKLKNGETVAYDKLLMATGARCLMPDIPGINLKGVVALREKSDLDQLHQLLDAGCKRVCVVGGGLLGLEMADNINRRGIAVTVLEACPALLPRQIDDEGAPLLIRAIETNSSVRTCFGVTLTSINGESKVKRVTTSAGENIDCDLVIVSVGISRNVEIGHDAGIAVNRGIIVNRYMETSVSNIYAAGDCAECDGHIFGLWNAARDQGMIAGSNMIGDSGRFESDEYGARLVAFGIKLFSIGETQNSCESEVVAKSQTAMEYCKLFYRRDRVVGGILLGNVSKASKLEKAVNENWHIDQVRAIFH